MSRKDTSYDVYGLAFLEPREISGQKICFIDLEGTLVRPEGTLGHLKKILPDYIYSNLNSEFKSLKSNGNKSTYSASASNVLGLIGRGIRGKDPEKLRNSALEYLERGTGWTYEYSEDLIKLIRDEGYKIVIISGTPVWFAREVGKQWDVEEVYATSYMLNDQGVFTGKVEMAYFLDKGKSGRARKSLSKNVPESSAAFEDALHGPLCAVDYPVAVNPDKKLHRLAEEKGWLVVREGDEDFLPKVEAYLRGEPVRSNC